MGKNKVIVWFNEVDKNDVGLVGGKGANLGEMTQAGFPVPFGFILTSSAYFEFIEHHKLNRGIRELLNNIDYENANELHQASKKIKDLINMQQMLPNHLKQIVDYYQDLTSKEEAINKTAESKFKHKLKILYGQPMVAVRSSATAEDLPTASFAGQQETFLNIKGEHLLLKKIQECWASIFTERAMYYRHRKHFDHFKVGLAAVVQRMVQSEKSGVAFSTDPVTNDRSKIVIEAVYGLGEYIVQGKVTPDHYEIDKKSFVILSKDNAYQSSKYIKSGSANKEVKLSRKEGSHPKLDDREIIKLSMLVKQIEDHYFFPQDIEWAIEKGKIFIVQSRPITTLGKVKSSKEGMVSETPILTGAPASPGMVTGPVKIVRSPAEINRVGHGDVLVTTQTNPDYVPAMRKAVAIITETGGRTSHAAIVSRELGIPAVVGISNLMKTLKDNQVVTVNGLTGEIFKGRVSSRNSQIPHQMNFSAGSQSKHLKTRTKVYVNLAEPDQATKVSRLNVDGIGLLRAEFMIANIGVHPKEFIKHKKQKEFVSMLTQDLMKFVRAFTPRPVIYRATDFKTNEYRNLKGGASFEPKEENPMLGFRGAARYVADAQVFSLELEAIREIWNRGYRNLHLMIPFIRVPWELIRIREIIEDHGLLELPEFKLWIMAEVPSCALNIEEFIKLGINGVSIGTNDLTMMLLGVDRDNEAVSNIYDERNPFVISVLRQLVETCIRNDVTVSICGQAASDYPEVIKPLMEVGITSVSVNPDAIDRTREFIYNFEKESHGKN